MKTLRIHTIVFQQLVIHTETPENTYVPVLRMSKTQDALSRKGTKFFKWPNSEVKLLLQVTQEYKVANASKNIDWETCQNKYAEILDCFKEQYPADDVTYTL